MSNFHFFSIKHVFLVAVFFTLISFTGIIIAEADHKKVNIKSSPCPDMRTVYYNYTHCYSRTYDSYIDEYSTELNSLEKLDDKSPDTLERIDYLNSRVEYVTEWFESHGPAKSWIPEKTIMDSYDIVFVNIRGESVYLKSQLSAVQLIDRKYITDCYINDDTHHYPCITGYFSRVVEIPDDCPSNDSGRDIGCPVTLDLEVVEINDMANTKSHNITEYDNKTTLEIRD